MNYYTDLFSPETYQAFNNSDKTISGFRKHQKNTVAKLKIGDILVCYVTRISRWVGLLEITDKYYEDSKPIFVKEDDPFVMRVKVKPIVWLTLDKAIPIHEDFIWDNLTFTQGLEKNSTYWTGMVRNSLKKLDDRDGKLLFENLVKQNESSAIFALSDEEQKKLRGTTVRTKEKEIEVVVPMDEEDQPTIEITDTPESMKIQALIARIGERMGMNIWLPRRDRGRVLSEWEPEDETLLEYLPLNYDDTTLKTIENIDVLWIKGRSIIRAFEVEHTTSIYSGILRMADLMALQPNLNIRSHIVAPDERKNKVLDEIRRPVFSLLEKGPLSESCSFISYDSIKSLNEEKNLEHMRDTVLEDYEELAEEI